jgi:uncharacterized membrane protein
MRSKWGMYDWLLLLAGLAPTLFGWVMYDRLPEQMAVHFNTSNEVDGYMHKRDFLLLFTALLLLLPIVMRVFPRIDPKRENYEKFAGAFFVLRLASVLVLAGAVFFVIMYNLGHEWNAQMFVMILLGVSFVFTGNYLGRVKPNFYVGLRTPWTLSDEEVWRRTHRLGGPIWVACGILLTLAAFLPESWAWMAMILLLLVSILVPTIYSYRLFQKRNR